MRYWVNGYCDIIAGGRGLGGWAILRNDEKIMRGRETRGFTTHQEMIMEAVLHCCPDWIPFALKYVSVCSDDDHLMRLYRSQLKTNNIRYDIPRLAKAVNLIKNNPSFEFSFITVPKKHENLRKSLEFA